MWGEESGDRVHVVLDGRRVAAIICRLDLRAFCRPFAQGALRLAQFCGCKLRGGAGRLFTPTPRVSPCCGNATGTAAAG
jgi:hypothetical protein